ncbi:MAG: alpha/beta hydrolase [Pseudomonadota bacterium]
MSSAAYIKEEKDFYVTARDSKDIFIRYAAANDNPDRKAVVLAHGICGQPEEYIHMFARNYFTEKGYDVYRMSFYDDGDNSRKIHTTTLLLQANDMNDVISHAKESHDKVYVCGHSYGGATILFANPDTNATAFWDSSFDVTRFWKDVKIIDGKPMTQSWRINMLFNPEMMEHANSQSTENMESLAQSISSPSVVITALKHDMVDQSKNIFKSLTCEKEYHEIANAKHRFTQGDTALELYNATHQWFERF